MGSFELQFVYMMVMEGDAFQVKIGFSNNPIRRCRELYNSSVPHPFQLLHVWEVEDMRYTEKLLHDALDDCRVSHRREFFNIYHRYEHLIDVSLPQSMSGAYACNQLSQDIDEFLEKKQVQFRRWYIDQLEDYDWRKRNQF